MTSVAFGVGAACTTPEGRPPLARIELMPAAIPENDDFRTPVTLDGSTSADPLDDPEGAERLDFTWEIIGEARFDQGDEHDPAPVVLFRGDRPAAITLTVTDADGLSASSTAYVQLTTP